MARPVTVLLALMKLDIGGAETHVVVLARHLKKMGYKVIMASAGGRFEEEIARYGIKHYRVPLHQHKISSLWRSIWALRNIVHTEKIDLIHAHARIPAFVTAVMRKPRNVHFITTAHFNFDYRYGLKYISQWGEKTITVSEDIKEYLIKYFRVPAEKIIVIPNGIDTDAFSPFLKTNNDSPTADKNKDTISIAHVSRLDGELAGVALNLIAASEHLSALAPAMRLAIVGDGNKRGEVERRAQAFNVRQGTEVVTMLGARTDVNKIMAKSDLVVGVSRVALEAMACAKPVLLAGPQGFGGLLDRQNLHFFQKDNFTARLSGKNTTVENLVSSLQEFLNRPVQWRTDAGKHLREFVKKEYSSLQMAQKVAQVYQDTLGKLLSS